MVARRELQWCLLDSVGIDEDYRHRAAVILLMHMQINDAADVEIYCVLPQPLSAVSAWSRLRCGCGLRAKELFFVVLLSRHTSSALADLAST